MLLALTKLLDQGLVPSRTTVAFTLGNVICIARGTKLVGWIQTGMNVVGVDDGQVKPTVSLSMNLREHGSSSHQRKRDEAGDPHSGGLDSHRCLWSSLRSKDEQGGREEEEEESKSEVEERGKERESNEADTMHLNDRRSN